MLASWRLGLRQLRLRHMQDASRIQSIDLAGALQPPAPGWAPAACRRRSLAATAAGAGDKPQSGQTAAGTGDKTQSGRSARDLGLDGAEPPIETRASRAAYTADELERAVARLQGKLARYVFYPRTYMKLEAMWALYMRIRAASQWRVGAVEAEQFLRAILRSGEGTFWCERAQLVADEVAAPASGELTMALIRVFAKFGDVQLVRAAEERAARAHGPGWAGEQADFTETLAIAYARADLPARAEETLQGSRAFMEAGQAVSTKPVPAHIVALRETVLAWARARDAGKAWAGLAQLLARGYGRAAREWNAVLSLHANDARYRYTLLEQVLQRMRDAGAAPDAATHNIMMHGSLLRGQKARWREWFERMQRAGLAPDAVTYTTLLTRLAHGGQWAEALRVVQHMRTHNVAMTSAARAAALGVERQRNRTQPVMQQFRRLALGGGAISADEFSVVVAAVLDAPRRWAREAALAMRCLQDGRVAESAVVDALAARLPGIGAAQIADRPLLRLLQGDAGHVAGAFAHGIQGNAGAFSQGVQSGAPADARALAVGPRRRSFAHTLNVAIRHLLHTRNWAQAEALVRAAADAHIDTSAPHTLVALLGWCAREGAARLPQLQQQMADATFSSPAVQPSAQLVASVKAGDMARAQLWFERLERRVADMPSVRAFDALLTYAAALQDTRLLERTWRQQELSGVAASVTGHQTRIFCYSHADDLLRTRRAYTDMLDDGYPPTFPAVGALVRCCVRGGDLSLALHVMCHAERVHGTALNATAYNYVLSRLGQQPERLAHMHELFGAMLATSDERLCHAASDARRAVEREHRRFADLRVLDAHTQQQGAWLLRPDTSREPSARLRRALVSWLTSRFAYSAEPTLVEPRDEPPAVCERADAPPPDATTFIVVMRACGRQARWADVVRAWDALASFNRRVDALAAQCPSAAAHRVAPISRMVGWQALALARLGRRAEAERLWSWAVSEGVMSASARELGMDEMLRRLPIK